ncbi:probable protein S-acyltransferase 4 [Musa acuminata AAA Group]|uniref:probable protein S-acyltransferase 4 n=1 Tax=Musa acuminata AAA Group TaxID=214697 RepID=UPI0031D45661
MATPAQQANPRRLYQVWKGNNRFFCGGRLIFGPDVASLLLSTLLIVGPAITFCCQIIIKLHEDEKSDENPDRPMLWLSILMVAFFVTISDLVFLFMTSSIDPGIVPRNTGPPGTDESVNVNTPSMEWIHGRTPQLQLPRARTKDEIVNGFAVKVKYCETCMLYRPPRASHCSVCNNCVHKFDHHCPWIGQCIGQRNYRFFFFFISTSTFLCIYVFTFSWLNIITEMNHHQYTIWKAMKCEILSPMLIVYTFIAVWFVGGLTVFHFYLICTNQTTNENFRWRYDKKQNPYDKGFLRNFGDVFLSEIPPSMHDFRSWVTEETIQVEFYTPNIDADVISPTENIDIEISTEPAIDDNLSVPSIQQNFDCSSNDALDPSVYPVTQNPSFHAPTHSMESYDGENGMPTDETKGEDVGGPVKDESVIKHSCSNMVVTPVEDVDMRST